MVDYHTERALILTKTYPAPSRKYRETSCVAAINEKGELRRLFPIPFRLLDGDQQFQRWEWIRARLSPARNDHRPESFRVDTDSIERLGRVGTGDAWSERHQWIEQHIVEDFEALEVRRQNEGKTLGFIRPAEFSLIIERATNPDWTEEEKRKLIQDGLFDSPDAKSRVLLKKVPYDFYYRYRCGTPGCTQEHRHKITDWEAGALYWNCVKSYGDQWEKYFRMKLEAEFSTRDLIFMMGTIHRFPDKWLIVGLVYPPKVEARQISMFLEPADA